MKNTNYYDAAQRAEEILHEPTLLLVAIATNPKLAARCAFKISHSCDLDEGFRIAVLDCIEAQAQADVESEAKFVARFEADERAQAQAEQGW